MVSLIKSSQELDALRQSNEDRLMAVFFTSPWSGPCLRMDQYFEALAPDYDDVQFVKATLPDNDYSRAYGVERLPTILFFRQSQQVGKVVGEFPRQLQDALTTYRQ
ncbi:thioredoxin-like protein [Syncephalis fuscata]|nr:thioredoxin-like protein [Syncephalis fuscata]